MKRQKFTGWIFEFGVGFRFPRTYHYRFICNDSNNSSHAFDDVSRECALRSAKIQRAHGQCLMDPPLHMYKKSSGKRPCYAACSPMLSCKPSTTARVDGTRPPGGGDAFEVSRKRREKSDDCHREQGPRSGFAQPSCAKGGPTLPLRKQSHLWET